MSTTKLALYNGALKHLSTVRLANLNEDRKERYELDAVYDATLAECLELGLWKFAKRTVKMEADTGVEPEFGYPYAFAFPEDFVRMFYFALDEFGREEVEDRTEENEVWYCNVNEVYLSYVSNGLTYGLDLGKYTPHYANFVSTRLALNSVLPITRDKFTRNDLLNLDTRMLKIAKGLDAVDEPVKYKPTGRLVQARLGRPIPQIRNGKFQY